MKFTNLFLTETYLNLPIGIPWAKHNGQVGLHFSNPR